MNTTSLTPVLCALASSVLAGPGAPRAPAASPDKSRFSLVDPTPVDLMREMSTDRPDQTESPCSVDAGHVQIEMDFINWTHDRSGGETVDSIAFAPVNIKIGLTNNMDLQLVHDSYTHERTRSGGLRSSVHGWGDLTARLKINLWGNDGGDSALALMPFVKIPLGSSAVSNGAVEGGLIIPLAISLSEKAGLGLMTEVDIIADDGGGGHHLEWLNSATIGFDLTEKLGAYVEVVAVVRDNGAPWVGQFDAGLTYGLTDNVQLDCGCNFGLTESAPDYQPFVGLSVRF